MRLPTVFKEGKRCKACGTTRRYQNSGDCVECVRARGVAFKASNGYTGRKAVTEGEARLTNCFHCGKLLTGRRTHTCNDYCLAMACDKMKKTGVSNELAR